MLFRSMIDHGKIVSDGDKNIVVGLGFPGMEENLNLEGKDIDIDIPDSFKVKYHSAIHGAALFW